MSDVVIAAALDRNALAQAIREQGADFQDSLSERHAHLFADAALTISASHYRQMQAVIASVEQVVSLSGWMSCIPLPNPLDETTSHSTRLQTTAAKSLVIPQAGEGTSAAPSVHDRSLGVFYGYDFHLNESGAHLIEINTNAGGAFLNALLLRSQSEATSSAPLEHAFLEMFRNEWRLVRGSQPLQVVAILDERPAEQYLYPEFILAQRMFARAGLHALIADPSELAARADGLYLGVHKIGLVYNRLTDFALENHPALAAAYRDGRVVLTPSPLAYARYADKRNLVRLTDREVLRALGANDETIGVLQQGIPHTRLVSSDDAGQWWGERKQWFFKPVSGYGAKGAYRGDKITKRVFDEIISGDYVAQRLAAPGECVLNVNGEDAALKFDVRCYVYDGNIQLVAARLYQGQTTNFRTRGGGFAAVRVSG